GAVHLLRSRARCTASAGHPGSGRRNPRAADARSWRARRLHRGSHARHHAGLRGFSPRLSRRSLGAAGEGDRRRAPRGDHLAPPPPPPLFFLPPPPPDFVVLTPPFAPVGLFILPQPYFVPVAAYVRPPVYVAAPANNIIFNNIHNTTVINNTINVAPKVQNNITTAAVTGQTGAGPQIPNTLKAKAAAINSGQAAIPPNTLVNTNAKTSTKQVFPVNATSTSTTTTAPPPGTATKLLSGTQQGTGTQPGTATHTGTGTQQGTQPQGTANLKPANALPGSPAGTALPGQTAKGNDASKGATGGTTGPGAVIPNTKLGTTSP